MVEIAFSLLLVEGENLLTMLALLERPFFLDRNIENPCHLTSCRGIIDICLWAQVGDGYAISRR